MQNELNELVPRSKPVQVGIAIYNHSAFTAFSGVLCAHSAERVTILSSRLHKKSLENERRLYLFVPSSPAQFPDFVHLVLSGCEKCS